MKSSAVHFVVAAAIVGVAWDAIDKGKAHAEDGKWLAVTNHARTAAGVKMIYLVEMTTV
jgi:hypothetical protein